MRLKKVTLHKNRPISYDIIEIEDSDGQIYSITDSEIEEMIEAQYKC